MRRRIFQIHLWMGVIVAAYAALIGVTGSLLVFRQELQKAAFPRFFAFQDGPRSPEPSMLIDAFQGAYPGYRVVGLDYPTRRRGTVLAYLIHGGDLRTVFSDTNGKIIGELPKTSWIGRLQNLHADLFAGPGGRVVNGVCAAAILVMLLTGILLWNPRRLRLGRRARDLHIAAGVTMFGIVLLWSVSGIEFAFPGNFDAR